MTQSCDTCEFFDWDEELQENVCFADLDEDDYGRLMQNRSAKCPYYKYYDEYKTVQKQN